MYLLLELLLSLFFKNHLGGKNRKIFGFLFQFENKKLKKLENDFDKLQTSLSDKEKIIGLYEFMLNGNPPITNSSSVVKRTDS